MAQSTTSDSQKSPAGSYAAVLLLLAAATGGSFALDHQVSLTSQAMLYVLAVVVASYALRTLPSVLCAVGAVAAFNFFFVPPRWTFAVDSQEHLIALFTMLAVALVINHLNGSLRRKTELARLNARRAGQLQVLAVGLATADSDAEVRQLGQSTLDAAFAGPTILATLSKQGDLIVEEGELEPVLDGLRTCMREKAALGPGTGRWPGLNAWYLPLSAPEGAQGAACIHNVDPQDHAGREHAQAVCAMVGQALWRLSISAAMHASQAESHRQQIQSTFLAAISHDLRTPLAAVVGAASSLQSQGEKLSPAEHDRLISSILDEASYLAQVTENTLQLVQLGNAAQPLRRDWESMQELVGSVVGRMRQRDPTRRISAKVPDGLPLLRVDAVLIAQLLGNLLDNAVKYSQGPVDLVVALMPQHMQVAIKDRAAVIPAEQYEGIFQPYARNDQSGQRGAGLGLALCRAIAAAHGGNIGVRARQGGGNCFTVTLPLEPEQPAMEVP